MKLSRINTGLLILIILVNGYIVCMPLLPAVHYWWQARGDTKEKLTKVLHPPAAKPDMPASKPDETIPAGNRLVIPAMMLDVPFFEGASARVLNKGPWLRPGSSQPDKESNTVIAAHRFTYTDPEGDFYHLDKLKPGDEIGLFKDGRKYLYIVESLNVVGPDDTAIEAPTAGAQLTLYTCTPLWRPKDRLVVVAKPHHSIITTPKGH